MSKHARTTGKVTSVVDDEQERREQGGDVGTGAESANVAALDSIIPNEKGYSHWPDSQPYKGKPFAPLKLKPRRRFKQEVTEEGQERRHAAETANRIGRHIALPTAQHGIR